MISISRLHTNPLRSISLGVINIRTLKTTGLNLRLRTIETEIQRYYLVPKANKKRVGTIGISQIWINVILKQLNNPC